jgi:class 3 adenylate cyclase
MFATIPGLRLTMVRGLSRFALFYPLRIVGCYFVAFVIALYSIEFNQLSLFRIVLIGFMLIYPHLVRYFEWRYSQDRLKVELRAFLVDSFIVGLTVYLTGYTPLPGFVLVTIALVNGLSVAGFRQMFLSACSVLVGIAIATLFGGANFAPQNVFALDIAVSIFLFVYFLFFGFSVYISNALLARSRTEMREQKSVLEIEKQRSDALLLDLVPAGLADELKSSRHIEPAEFEPVTLIAVDFGDFVRTLEAHDPRKVLAHLMHCFKAFDAIAGRHGFEKLRTMGDIYITVAGVPLPGERDAARGIEAALEIRQFLDDLAGSRRAHGEFVLDARIAVHSGRVFGGIVETQKMSYDLWGTTMKILLRLLKEAPGGEVVISDATRALAGEGFLSTPAGNVAAGAGAGIPFFNVEKRAA